MNTSDIHTLYLAGTKVPEPWAGDDNFLGVLDEREIDYDWRMIVLPLDIVCRDIDTSLEPNPGAEADHEAIRFTEIVTWARERGGLTNALTKRPPAIIIDETKAMMVDGRHRLALATQEKLTHIHVIVGVPSGFLPSSDIDFPSYDPSNTISNIGF